MQEFQREKEHLCQEIEEIDKMERENLDLMSSLLTEIEVSCIVIALAEQGSFNCVSVEMIENSAGEKERQSSSSDLN